MRDVKRRIENYSFYDRSGIAAHLEAMAAKGWQLEHITATFWYYHRAEPQQLHYAVTYDTDGSAFDPVPNGDNADFYELCAHQGWEFVTAFAEMQIFVNSRPDPVPLETDPAVDLVAIEKSAKRRLTKPYWAILVIGVVVAFLGIGGFINDPVYSLSGVWGLPMGVVFLLLGIAAAAELRSYYRWRALARTAAERGERVKTSSPMRLTRTLMTAVCAVLALAVLGALFSGDEMLRASLLVVLVACLIANVVMRVSVDKFKRSGMSRIFTAVFSVLIVFVLCFALYSLGGEFIYDSAVAHSEDERYVNYSLSLYDLTGENRPGYIRSASRRESVILAQSSLDEFYSEHASEPGGEDVGRLEYTTTYVKLPALYGFCERSLSRGGESTDPEPWGALRAYSMGGNAYTLCYPGRVVEISLPFSPTAEQMAIVYERLGN